MDNQRLLIWAFFGLIGWITYQTWIQDYAQQPVATTSQAVLQSELTSEGGDLPELSAPTDGALNTLLPIDVTAPELTTGRATASTAPSIRVTTDVLDIEISTEGGTLQSARMLGYPIAKDQPDILIQLLSTDDANFGAIQTGLRIVGEGEEPNHQAMFSSGSSFYSLDGFDELVVPLRWRSADGIVVEKRYRFTRGGYAIAIEQEIINGGAGLWRGTDYSAIQRISKEQ
jgi:YidC/Oxa1 family membrane protein insertase